MWKTLWKHPFWAALGSIVALCALIATFVQPIYASVPDGDLCGWDNVAGSRPAEHEFNECRDSSHGVDSFQYNETVSDSSGKVGGGHDQGWWCNAVMRAKETAIGQSIVWATPKSSEESDKNWKGEVSYKYSCSIDGSWGPIFKLDRTAVCGRAALIVTTEQVPKICSASERLKGVRILGMSWIIWP